MKAEEAEDREIAKFISLMLIGILVFLFIVRVWGAFRVQNIKEGEPTAIETEIFEGYICQFCRQEKRILRITDFETVEQMEQMDICFDCLKECLIKLEKGD